MNLLLDTHNLLWLMQGPANLSNTAAALLTDPANRLYLSMASAWETATKVGLKKMGLSVSLATFLTTAVGGYGLTVLPITTDDCIGCEAFACPNPQHRDPFDRMIVVHAVRNGLSIVGVDAAFDAYGVTRLW